MDLKTRFRSYIVEGNPIPPDTLALGKEYQLKEVPYLKFDLNFNLSATQRDDVIIGVEKDSPAYNKGVRDGMELIEIYNANRFGAAWESETPIKLLVKVGDRTESIEYNPEGKKIMVPQYVKVK